MGWADCGKNPKTGEMMGYAHRGRCSALLCSIVIDHGLSFVCGGMHEGGTLGCGKYFCSNHLTYGEDPDSTQLCFECAGLYDAE